MFDFEFVEQKFLRIEAVTARTFILKKCAQSDHGDFGIGGDVAGVAIIADLGDLFVFDCEQ